METKHTPGPWMVVEATGYDTQGKPLPYKAIMDRAINVTVCDDARMTPADAYLIAAAPDLLDLLKASYRALHDPRNPEFDLGGKYFPLAKLLETAIAKAEGK